VQAAAEVKGRLLELASTGLEAPVESLETGSGFVNVHGDPQRRMSFADLACRSAPGEISATATVNPGSTEFIVNSFGAHFVEVEVETGSGRVRIRRYVAAHDSGRIINPLTSLNQVEGAISQMLGFSLTEELITDRPTGITLNGSYLEHKCPTIQDYPHIQVIFADVVDPVGPLGAKALGEVPCPGVAPAIANAVYDAIGVRFTRLPITPDRVLDALYPGGPPD
jgi:xanthine dehydrogenase molybdenum-binding subunit